MAKATKKTASETTGSKRTLISPNGDNRYIRRDSDGKIKESDDQGKSLAKDVKQHSKTEVKSGQGDKGDKPKKSAAKKKGK